MKGWRVAEWRESDKRGKRIKRRRRERKGSRKEEENTLDWGVSGEVELRGCIFAGGSR
jgi:hypothetical protein